MKIIENNPFRILGIISNATAKETNESETFILRYLDIGKSAVLKFDITPPLNSLDSNSEIVKNAKRKIHDSFDNGISRYNGLLWCQDEIEKCLFYGVNNLSKARCGRMKK